MASESKHMRKFLALLDKLEEGRTKGLLKQVNNAEAHGVAEVVSNLLVGNIPGIDILQH